MAVAGIATGVVMAWAEADGSTAVLILPVLRAAPLGRILRGRYKYSPQIVSLRSAPVGYAADCVPAASLRRSFASCAFLNDTSCFHSAAPMDFDYHRVASSPAIRDSAFLNKPSVFRSAPVGYAADCVPAASRRRSFASSAFLNDTSCFHSAAPLDFDYNRAASSPVIRDSALLNKPSVFRSAPMGFSRDNHRAPSKSRFVRATEDKQNNGAETDGLLTDADSHGPGTDSAPTASSQEVSPTWKEKLLVYLRSDVFKLFLLGVSFCIGSMATKEYKMAVSIVDAQNLQHRVKGSTGCSGPSQRGQVKRRSQ